MDNSLKTEATTKHRLASVDIAVCWSLLYFLYRKNIFIKV